jgi:hypothetical protein
MPGMNQFEKSLRKDGYSLIRPRRLRQPSVELPFGERSTGTGLQIPLEGDSAHSTREFQRHKKPPRPVSSSMNRAAGIVRRESGAQI